MKQIGIDMIRMTRFKNIKKSDMFIKNTFTNQEQKYCFTHTRPEVHLAAAYCVKEAVRKTIQKKYVPLKEIELFHTRTGKPFVKVKNKRYGTVSLSHTDDLVVAVVMV